MKEYKLEAYLLKLLIIKGNRLCKNKCPFFDLIERVPLSIRKFFKVFIDFLSSKVIRLFFQAS